MNGYSDENRNEKGFSLIELLIAMIIFLMATAAIFGVMKIAQVQKNTVNNRTDQLRSARIAVDYIRRDAINAGFGYHRAGGNAPDNAANNLFGLPNDVDTLRDLMTSIVGGNNINTNSLNTTAGLKTDTVAFFSRDASFNSTKLINYLSVGSSGSTVFVKTKAGEAKDCKANDLYLLESGTGTTQVLGMATTVTDNEKIEFAFDDPLKLNQKANVTGEAQSLLMSSTGAGTIKKVNLVGYSVTPEGVLVRKTYGNRDGSDQVELRELVYGVSDFQIQYFLEDGTSVDIPSSNHDGRENQQKMNNVVQMQISITIVPNFNGSQGVSGIPITIREFVSTRNLRYEAS